jgi:hypothetical protein
MNLRLWSVHQMSHFWDDTKILATSHIVVCIIEVLYSPHSKQCNDVEGGNSPSDRN